MSSSLDEDKQIEKGDKAGEAASYVTLGSSGEYVKAEEYLQKALQIQREIGNKDGEATCYLNLANVFKSLSEYVKAEEYLQKALQMKREIGDRDGEASCYLNLANVFKSLSEYVKAEEYLQKALQIKREIGDKDGEAACHGILGDLLFHTDEHFKAKQAHEKALALSNKIGCLDLQRESRLSLAWDTLGLTGNIEGAVSSLLASIEKCEKMRMHLRNNDQYKISFIDKCASPYKLLRDLFLDTGKFHEALCSEELSRARALADLMTAQYSVEQETPVNPRSWFNIERTETKESNCSCLYISCRDHQLLFWVIKPDKTIDFRLKDLSDHFGNKIGGMSVDKIFDDIFRSVEDDEDENQYIDPLNLSQCYKMIIGPVAE